MLNEIKIYEILITKKIPFLKILKRKESIRYILSYRIDEDRIWYYKFENNKQIDDHLMKQNLENSVSTMENIASRFEDFNKFSINKCKISIIDLYKINRGLYDEINKLSAAKENYYNKKKKDFLFLSDEL